MAYRVDMRVPTIGLSKADVEFVVRKNGKQLGHCHVSKGSIHWYPERMQKKRYILTWERFAELMEKYGRENKK
jgi:hypothetical protein